MYQELYHHGVAGQHWGVKNGPPYPLTKEAKKALSKFFDNFKTTNETKRKTDGVASNAKTDKKTEKYIDEQGRTVIPMNETYVRDKRAKKYVKVNK